MTKNGDFGQNRKNRSTSNACRIAGTQNAFRFFSFKIIYIIAEHKKVSAGSYPLNKFPSDHSKMFTKFAVAGWVQTIKKILSQNHIENFIVIILGRFLINETQN